MKELSVLFWVLDHFQFFRQKDAKFIVLGDGSFKKYKFSPHHSVTFHVLKTKTCMCLRLLRNDHLRVKLVSKKRSWKLEIQTVKVWRFRMCSYWPQNKHIYAWEKKTKTKKAWILAHAENVTKTLVSIYLTFLWHFQHGPKFKPLG